MRNETVALMVVSVLLGGTNAYAVETYCGLNPVVYCNDFDVGSWDGMEHEGDANLVSVGDPGQHIYRGQGAIETILYWWQGKLPLLCWRLALDGFSRHS